MKTTTIRAAAVMAAALLLATAAAAQETPIISLAPSDPPRWDLAGHVAWFGSPRSRVGSQGSRRYEVAAGGVTVGRYWTPHLKTEIQGTVARQGRIYSAEQVAVPGQSFPSYVPSEHVFQATTVHAGVAYQWFENQWFHPFAGGGLDVVRERRRTDLLQRFISSREFPTPQAIPGSRGTEQVNYAARPFVDAGFKLFVSDHAFIRSELTMSISGRGLAQTAWSSGVGIEF